MDYTPFITVEPDKRDGQPCIRGLRITVRDVLENLANGMALPESLIDFPELTLDDVRASLAFAASHLSWNDGTQRDDNPTFDVGPLHHGAAARLRAGSPRLADPAQAVDFAMEMAEEPEDAGL